MSELSKIEKFALEVISMYWLYADDPKGLHKEFMQLVGKYVDDL